MTSIERMTFSTWIPGAREWTPRRFAAWLVCLGAFLESWGVPEAKIDCLRAALTVIRWKGNRRQRAEAIWLLGHLEHRRS